jgi:hypothetical protein
LELFGISIDGEVLVKVNRKRRPNHTENSDSSDPDDDELEDLREEAEELKKRLAIVNKKIKSIVYVVIIEMILFHI